MKDNFIHVVPRGNQWAAVREGADRASGVHTTQAQAIAQATALARDERGEVLIHGRNAQIRDRNSYGNDPSNRKG